MSDKSNVSPWLSIIIAGLALGVTSVNVFVAHSSYKLNQETQKAAMFSQFQQQYNTIAARFPAQLLDPNFRPQPGSDDYRKLEDYWIFCYAEWFETTKNGPEYYRNLWDNYYSGLILNALETPSLRYVLIDMSHDYGVKRKDMQEFYSTLRSLAKDAGEPLADAPAAPSTSIQTP